MKLLAKHIFVSVLGLTAVMMLPSYVHAQGDKNESKVEVKPVMTIIVIANGKVTIYQLNNSPAAKDLYAQLPLNVNVENYNDNEKIFYPPRKLNTTNTPRANARVGTLAYYAPWADVVMFYGNFGSATGLYELGHAVSGSEHINEMTGILRIEKGP